MKQYEYILFDVAGTLLYKPAFYTAFLSVLTDYGYQVNEVEFKNKHKLLTEVIQFPDRTSKDFYSSFNAELLYALGIVPSEEILEKLFAACSYLPWQKFEDTEVLNDITLPIGIISNFNTTLKSKLDVFFGSVFSHVLVSEELGIAKPEIDFYKRAVEEIDISPQKILYIGDSVKLDIMPAIRLGIDSLLIDRDHLYPASKNRINSLRDVLKLING